VAEHREKSILGPIGCPQRFGERLGFFLRALRDR